MARNRTVRPEGAAVVFEDERLVAAAKPSGQPTIPGRGAIGEALNRELERRRGRRLYVVHRLDREASGVVVFAKDAQTHRRLCALFERRAVEKVYLAAVAGAWSGSGETDAPLKEFGSGRVAPAPGGKAARTRWRVERTWADASLLRVTPETGRKHQIRAHLCALGHPVLGDVLYGPAPRPVGGAPRLMLHALSLAFEAGRRYALAAPPPPDFAAVLDALSPRRTFSSSARMV